MSEHRAVIRWKRCTDDFQHDTYNREHTWEAKGNVVNASAAPEFKGKPGYVDPEETLVAAVSNCHMLTFLAIAAKKKLVIDDYVDEAVGFLETDADGKMWVTRIELNPRITFAAGINVSTEMLQKLHDSAHHHCFIVNSIKSTVVIK